LQSELFTNWLEPGSPSAPDIDYFVEKAGGRESGFSLLKALVVDHFVGESTVMKLGGYEKAAAVLKNSLPTAKRTQSGDLGELLATEYVNSQTEFTVPIKKLRWKSDRQMPMHGNDVLGLNYTSDPRRILKCECKSRKQFGDSAVTEASEGLDGFDGRPNPSTVAFITKRLFEDNRVEEAKMWSELQTDDPLPAKNHTQMVFALGGNDPTPALKKCPKSKIKGIQRKHAAIRVSAYADFILGVYTIDGK
jgi:HamA